MEILRELLSEVLDINDIVHIQKEGASEVFISRSSNPAKIINIYELAYKCKEWAFSKGFEIVVLAYMIRIYRNGYEVYYTNTTLFDLDMFLKSCEWILKEISK